VLRCFITASSTPVNEKISDVKVLMNYQEIHTIIPSSIIVIIAAIDHKAPLAV
jgi:hypothetical protein